MTLKINFKSRILDLMDKLENKILYLWKLFGI